MKVYRFELSFFDEPQGVGILQGLDETALSGRKVIRLLEPFQSKLRCPDLSDKNVNGSGVVFWFTEEGLREFCSAIHNIIAALDPSGWGVIMCEKDLCDGEEAFSVYSDKYQIAWLYEDIHSVPSLIPKYEPVKNVFSVAANSIK